MGNIKLSTGYLIFNHIHIFSFPYCLLSVLRIRSGHQYSLHWRQSLSFLTLRNTCLFKTLICLFLSLFFHSFVQTLHVCYSLYFSYLSYILCVFNSPSFLFSLCAPKHLVISSLFATVSLYFIFLKFHFSFSLFLSHTPTKYFLVESQLYHFKSSLLVTKLSNIHYHKEKLTLKSCSPFFLCF